MPNLTETAFNPVHDALDRFLETVSINSMHRSVYNTFFDYLKSAPQTDTFAFKQASADIYLLLEFFKELEELTKKQES